MDLESDALSVELPRHSILLLTGQRPWCLLFCFPSWTPFSLVVVLCTLYTNCTQYNIINDDHVQPLLQTLHWLPIQARIDYKRFILCHNVFSQSTPAYISELLSTPPSRQLRSSAGTHTLRIHHSIIRRKTLGQRSFSFCGPIQWNSLPADVCHIQTGSSFKSHLRLTCSNSTISLSACPSLC